jgi:hypothetical protein
MNSTELPAELATAVRTTAARVPDLPLDLAGVRVRARAFRRRRTALRVAAVAAIVVGLGAAVPVVRSAAAPSETVGSSSVVPLGLWLDRDKLPLTQGWPSGRVIPGDSGQIAAQLRIRAGKATITPVGKQPGLVTDEGYLGPAPLPGGQLATVGFLDVPHPADQLPPGYQVVVADADGGTVASRHLPPTNSVSHRPMPFTGSSTTLFWWAWRAVGKPSPLLVQKPMLITYDIATGTLRDLFPTTVPVNAEIPYFGMQATATRLINWPAEFGRTCTADILDTGTGALVKRLRPAIAKCSDVYFALSPDNRRVAALVTYRDASTWSQRVISIDARTGAIQKEFRMPALAAGTDRTKLVSGIDWVNNKTIRYARGTLTGADPIVRSLRLH